MNEANQPQSMSNLAAKSGSQVGKRQDEILYVSLNQDQGCFSAGTQTGFRVYNTRPFRDQFKRGKLALSKF